MRSKAPVAIVGMSGIFPGAETLDQFWFNIKNRVSSIIDVPEDRWIIPPEKAISKNLVPDKAISGKAGLIQNFHFDTYGFDIDRNFLEALDPMYHLVLTAARDALSQSYLSEEIKLKTGVILAAIALPTDTASLVTRTISGKAFEKEIFGRKAIEKTEPLSEETLKGARVTSLPASILAKAFNLGGGSYTLDAACSSSLYSIKLACDELSSKRADVMVAGGVSRPEALFTQTGFSQLTALSPSGICAPFDKNADGLVVGEGAGVVVLKRIDDAIQNGDKIHGLIYGAGLSNDIGGNLLAPDSEGQIRAIKSAYKKTGWTPYDVDHIECHGTGTPVGDTIELKSLKAVWGNSGWEKNQCAIGSIKSMAGHLLTAAGIAGTIKTLLAFKNKTLPPSLNFSCPATDSPLNDGPFRVQTKASEWKTNGKKRRAAVSAFGFGGTNAHILFEEWTDDKSVHFVPDKIHKGCDIAITGIGTFFKNAETLSEFEDLIFIRNKKAEVIRGNSRWNNCHLIAEKHLKRKILPEGNYLDDFTVEIGGFHIPPNEISDILPQHIMMLKASKMAIDDAGIPTRIEKPEMGLSIGMEFDYEASDFNFRWYLDELTPKWNQEYNLGLSDQSLINWTEKLKDAFHPPLTSSRTTGALGGLIASRVAKEFKFGGPSFIVSSEETSGLKALEIGIRSIQSGETKAFLAGAVDLPGEIRNLISSSANLTFSETGEAKPFDLNQNGTIPGEGAVAVILKNAEQALKDGDNIYALIKGIGKASGNSDSLEKTYLKSLTDALKDAETKKDEIKYIEPHASGIDFQDEIEFKTLKSFFTDNIDKINLGCTIPYIGYSGAASGLASLIKTAMSLYKGYLPPFPFKYKPAPYTNSPGALKIPETKIKLNENLKACTSSIGNSGEVCHVILERKTAGLHKEKKIYDQKSSTPPKSIMINLTGNGYNPPMPPGYSPEIYVSEKIEHEETKSNIENDSKNLFGEEISKFTENIIQTAEAHSKFLEFSDKMNKNFAEAINFQSKLIENAISTGNIEALSELSITDPFTHDSAVNVQEPNHFADNIKQTIPDKVSRADVIDTEKPKTRKPIRYNGPEPAYSKEMCMEFATGSLAKVLGPEFAVVDTYPVRVRLPDAPLMLVDRILSVEGEKGSLSSGKLVTEHDVNEGDWYLDGGKTPVCISIESGQADLFLCSYLGIDLAVKGKRSYRLLDAVATFHEGLPVPGDTIRYEIEIEKFINHGETYMFFFHFNGFIGNRHIISMRNGCAGFFTEKEVKESGGIILTPEEKKHVPGKKDVNFKELVPFYNSDRKFSFDDEKVEKLRKGDLEGAFGPDFRGKKLASTLILPSGRMRLVDRVLEIDPEGGKYGIGSIRAEADIKPDAWFLKCHFVDDMVMPGTLMYECCMHTLRILAMRIGWVTDKEGVCIEPLPGVQSELKCRGPVTVETEHVYYDVEIKEIGYNPEPYIIADAHMYANEERIVMFKEMSLKFSGINKNEIETYWKKGNVGKK